MGRVTLLLPDANQGHLPRVCIYCGMPAVTKRRKTLTGSTPFTFFVGAGLKGILKVPVCDRHRFTTLWSHVPEIISFILMMTGVFVCSAISKTAANEFPGTLKPYLSWFGTATVVSLAACLVSRIFAHYRDIHCLELTDRSVTLAGVAPESRSALERFEEQDEDIDEVLPVRPARPPRVKPDVVDVLPVEDEDAIEVLPVEPPGGTNRRRRLGLGLVLALSGLAVLGLCCVGAGLGLWLFWSPKEVILATPRIQPLGLLLRVQVDYAIPGNPDPVADYVLVVRGSDGQEWEIPVRGAELRQSGQLGGDMQLMPFGGPLASRPRPGGLLTIHLERQTGPPGASRSRVSNAVTVPAPFYP